MQVHTTTGSTLQRNCDGDPDDSLKQAVRDKHKIAHVKPKNHLLPNMGSTPAPTEYRSAVMQSGTCPQSISHEKECPQLQVWAAVQEGVQKAGLHAEASIHAR